jgi:hypothetical protein
VRRGSSIVRKACAAVVIVAAAALLTKAFAGIDWSATSRAVAEAGRWAPLAFVPFVLAMTLDSLGMRLLLGALGRSVPLSQLVPIRVATEALHLTAPAGFVVADSATAALLDDRCGVPVGEGAVLAIARKWLVMRAHALYIVIGTTSGAVLLAEVSARSTGGRWLPWVIGLSALGPLGLSMGLGAGFRGKPALRALQDLLARAPWRWVRERVARWRSGAVTVDGHMARIGADRAATWRAAAAFFGCWLIESLETAIVVRLVGGPLDFGFAMAAEVGISMIRSVGNVAPAGLGVQDAGYALLFQAMGLPAHTTAAFVLLKRGKELAWIAVGYGLLAAMRRGTGSAGFASRIAGSAPVRAILGDGRRSAPRQPAV